jgi:peptidase inhibitor family I36
MVASVYTKRQLIVLIVLLFVAACQKELPMAPSDLVSGIVVYEHANYLGESAHITTDVADLTDFKGPCLHTTANCDRNGCSTEESWDDCISSVRVAPGWQAVLWEDDDYSGDRLTVTGDIPNLDGTRGCSSRGFNDCVTSIRLIRP